MIEGKIVAYIDQEITIMLKILLAIEGAKKRVGTIFMKFRIISALRLQKVMQTFSRNVVEERPPITHEIPEIKLAVTSTASVLCW
jgi:hypothetical protein